MARHAGLTFNFSLFLLALSLLPTAFAVTFYNTSSITSTSSNTSSTPTITAVQSTTYLTTTPSENSGSTITTFVSGSSSGSEGAFTTNSPAIQSSGNSIAIQYPLFVVAACAWAAYSMASL